MPVPCAANKSLMSLALMYLSNEREVVIVGGNSHLVVFGWEDRDGTDVLVENFSAPFVNVIDVVVCDSWFVIKYKRKRAKLFRVVVDADEFEIREGFELSLRPFKSRFRTLQVSRLRRGQLLIADVSFDSSGHDVQLEIFDLRAKRSVAIETLGLTGPPISALAYSAQFRRLAVFDEGGGVRLFAFDKDEPKRDRTGVQPLPEPRLENSGFVSRALLNASGKVLMLGTARGELLFYGAEDLKLRGRLDDLGFVVDLGLCEQARETILYVVRQGSRDLVKLQMEPVLGNLLMDRLEAENPIYKRGGPDQARTSCATPDATSEKTWTWRRGN